jgi:hypothetical protein
MGSRRFTRSSDFFQKTGQNLVEVNSANTELNHFLRVFSSVFRVMINLSYPLKKLGRAFVFLHKELRAGGTL